MIKGKGTIRKVNGILYADELDKACGKLPDNHDYNFLIVDDRKNRNLPHTAYLFTVVLKFISDNLPEHPQSIALYKYFEDLYAPVHTCVIDGKSCKYQEIKSEKVVDIDIFIEKIVKHAQTHWGIEVPTNEFFTKGENRELYSQAYLSQEIDWSSFLSSLKKSKDKDNERRSKECI